MTPSPDAPGKRDPHWAENDPTATTADVLYAALIRMVKDVGGGYWPGLGAIGQACRAIERHRREEERNDHI